MDRCFLELQVDGEEAYQNFLRVIENANVLMATYQDEALGDLQVCRSPSLFLRFCLCLGSSEGQSINQPTNQPPCLGCDFFASARAGWLAAIDRTRQLASSNLAASPQPRRPTILSSPRRATRTGCLGVLATSTHPLVSRTKQKGSRRSARRSRKPGLGHVSTIRARPAG